jgi:hypothetical protein
MNTVSILERLQAQAALAAQYRRAVARCEAVVRKLENQKDAAA